ncbi:MAG: hypothetical protein U0271_02815 [Polyangiaceae bacterium]
MQQVLELLVVLAVLIPLGRGGLRLLAENNEKHEWESFATEHKLSLRFNPLGLTCTGTLDALVATAQWELTEQGLH